MRQRKTKRKFKKAKASESFSKPNFLLLTYFAGGKGNVCIFLILITFDFMLLKYNFQPRNCTNSKDPRGFSEKRYVAVFALEIIQIEVR